MNAFSFAIACVFVSWLIQSRPLIRSRSAETRLSTIFAARAFASGEKLRLIHSSPTASPSAPFVAAAHCLTRDCCCWTPLVVCCQRNASFRKAELREPIAPFVTCQRRYCLLYTSDAA